MQEKNLFYCCLREPQATIKKIAKAAGIGITEDARMIRY
jgi:hypothetical protein